MGSAIFFVTWIGVGWWLIARAGYLLACDDHEK